MKHKITVDSKLKDLINTTEKETKQDKKQEQLRVAIQNVYGFCHSYYKTNKKFPKLSLIMSNTGLSMQQLKPILGFLLKQNKIKMHGKKYVFPGQKKKQVVKKISSIIKEKNKDSISQKIKLLFLFFFMGISSFIATCLSIYYTYVWFMMKTKNFIISFSLAFILVGFSVSAYQVVILQKQNKNYFKAILFLILWAVVLLFSMSSTVAGLYNQSRQIEKQILTENIDNSSLFYQELLAEESSIKIDIEDKIKERRRYILILQEFDTNEKIQENQKQVNRYRNIIYYIDQEIKKLKETQTKIVTEKKEFLQQNKNTKVIEQENYFVWVSRILNIKAFIIEFFLYVFPAIFIDIIAPLNFSVILFYKKLKKE